MTFPRTIRRLSRTLDQMTVPTKSLLDRLMAELVDRAPAFAWKPGNMRWVGSHTVHFCYGHDGHRTVEIDTREVIVGRRKMRPD